MLIICMIILKVQQKTWNNLQDWSTSSNFSDKESDGQKEIDYDISTKMLEMYFCTGDQNWADRIKPHNFIVYQVDDHCYVLAIAH